MGLIHQTKSSFSKSDKKPFCPMVHRCKKCSDILKVASVGGGQHASLKACHFSHFQFQLCHQRSLLKCHCTFYIYGPLVQKSTFSFSKDCLLAILSSKMSRHCPSHVLQDILSDNSIKRACLKNLIVLFLTYGP